MGDGFRATGTLWKALGSHKRGMGSSDREALSACLASLDEYMRLAERARGAVKAELLEEASARVRLAGDLLAKIQAGTRISDGLGLKQP